jgi:hypothetical protein
VVPLFRPCGVRTTKGFRAGDMEGLLSLLTLSKERSPSAHKRRQHLHRHFGPAT